MKKKILIFACIALCFSCIAKSLSLNETKITLGLGDEYQLVAAFVPVNAKASLEWKSTDPLKVSVDQSGKLTGRKATIEGQPVKITVTDLKSKLTAECFVIVKSEFYLSADNISISNITYKGYKYQIFENEDKFLEKINYALPIGTNLAVTDLVVKTIESADNWFLNGEDVFVVGENLTENTIGVTKDLAGIQNAIYSKKFSITFSYIKDGKEILLPFIWKDTIEKDTFQLPKNGEVLFVNDDFTIENSNLNNKSLDLVLKNLKSKIINSFETGETGDGKIKIKVYNKETIIGEEREYTISDDNITISLTSLNQENIFTFDFEISLTSGKTPTVKDNILINYIFPMVLKVQKEISPLHLSIVRNTTIDGMPKSSASALFNYGAEMEVLLSDYSEYDFDNATWSGKIVNFADNSILKEVLNAPYKKRFEFEVPLTSKISVKLTDGIIKALKKDNVNKDYLEVALNWTSEKFWGNSITIQNDSDFSKEICITNDYKKGDAGKKYKLVFGDDFNYHFNGLNYKNYANFLSVKSNENLDKEATLFSRIWDSEGTGPSPRKDISSWDLRNTETKNGILLQKAMVQNIARGTIWIGHNLSKPLTGYTDLSIGKNETKALDSNWVLTGCVRSKTVRFGYVEAKVRVKKKAYNSSVIKGAWYAFWLHGDMHEYDCMEFSGQESDTSYQVTHWHNGWDNYSTTIPKSHPGSTWINYKVPADYENEWWTLGLYWDKDKVVYLKNNEIVSTITAKTINGKENYGAQVAVINGTGKSNSAARDGLGNYDSTYNKSLTPQIGALGNEGVYDAGRLKGVLDVPMNIFASVALSSTGTWGGNFGDNYAALPTWLEVDYIAYYQPE